MKTRLKILWNLLCRPGSTFSRRLSDAAERMDSRASQADEDLRQKAGLMRIAGRMTNTGGWVFNVSNEHLFCSDEVVEILEFPPAHVPEVADIMARFVDPLRAPAAMEACVRDGIPFDLEAEILTAKNRRIWVRVCGEAERDAQGAILQVQGAFRDITGRKLAEQALRKSEEKFRLLADNLTDAFWIRSADMKTLHYLSPGYERIWGRPLADLQGSPHVWTDSIVPEDRERIRAVFASLVADAPRVSAEYRIFRPDGEVRWVHARGFQVRNAAGKLVGLTGVVTDITERKEAGESRRELAALLASAQRIGRMGSWCKHVRAGRLVWSDATCELFGITPEEFGGTFEFFRSFIVAEDLPAYDAVHALISPSNPVWETEYRIRWRDGALRWMHERGNAEFDAAGDPVTRTGMVMDVTDRKVSEDKLRESLSLLRMTGNVAGVGGWALDLADNMIHRSEDVWEMLGFSSENDRSLEEALALYSPESSDKLGAALAACGSDGTPFDLDLELSDAKGRKMWARVCGEAARDAGGKITKVHGAFSDITGRRQAQNALHQSEKEFRALAESMPQMVWKCRSDGGNVYFNQRWVDYTGLSLEESYGDGWSRPFHPDDKSRAREAWKNAIENGADYSLEGRLRDYRDDYRWFLIRGVALRDETGSVLWWFGTCTDIHDLKEAEKAARKNERGLRELTVKLEAEQARLVNAQAVAKLGSWETELSTGMVLWSAETYRIFEVAPDQFQPTHKRFLELVHPEDRVAVDEAFLRSAHQPSVRALEHRIPLPGGRIKFVEERWQIIFDEHGEPVRATGTVQDITEQRQVHRALQKEREFLAALVENVSDGIVSCDANGEITLFNGATREFHGLPADAIPADVRARTFDLYLPDGETLMTKEQIPLFRALRDGSVRDAEMIIAPQHGQARRILASGRAFYDAQGEKLGAVVAMHDITGQRKAQEEIRRQAHMLDQIGQAVIATDTGGSIIYANRFAGELYGWTPEEMRGSNIMEVTVSAAARKQAEDIMDRMRKGECWSGEFLVQSRDGRGFPAWVKNSPLLDEDGRLVGIVGISADISSRKQADAEREEMNKQLVDVSRQAGMAEVATNVLHNVGNVLNSVNISCSVISDKVRKSRISGVAKTAELLQRHQGDLAAFFTGDPAGQKLPEYMGKLADRLSQEQAAISAEVQSLRGNIDHIKDIVARQQNLARVCGVTEIIPIKDLIEDALRLSAEALSRHQIRVVRDYAEMPPVVVEKHKVLQILVNLIGNAKSACSEAGRSDKQITLRLTADGGTVRIAVIDNGVGISPENLTRIFAHGFTTKSDGHGFGLHGAVLAAREMGGDLKVHSDGSGKGATFTLELPPSPGSTK